MRQSKTDGRTKEKDTTGNDKLLHLALDFGFYRKNEAESGDRNSTQRHARGLTIIKKKNSESQNYTSYSYSSVLSASAGVLDK